MDWIDPPIPSPPLQGEWVSETVPTAENGPRLVLFWSAACLNCLAELPVARTWQARFGPSGLTTVAIHPPEYRFEANPEYVRRAAARLAPDLCVLADPDRRSWQSFTGLAWWGSARPYWPALYLLDERERIRAVHQGEQGLMEVERGIRQLLGLENGSSNSPIIEVPLRPADLSPPCYLGYRKGRPEVALGYPKGCLANQEGYAPNQIVNHQDPRGMTRDRFYLDGPWLHRSEALLPVGPAARLRLIYRARDVYGVLGDDSTEGCVRVMVEGGEPSRESWGSDLTEGPEGTILQVGEPRLYHLLTAQPRLTRALELVFPEEGPAVYGFAFAPAPVPLFAPVNP